ncbi:unnamed protein product [Linum tenue]|uniref:3-hydroxyisobutyrate dehydrogenase n=1 Tax=Linum tenue TaxID=586396 RepID=A0AAV0QK00_9ROSI|nr:unnamed protein product [Linum tenue]
MAICRARVRAGALLSLFRHYSERACSSSPISSNFQNVGFIGLGNMGFRMANNLIRAGFNLAVHDINHGVMKMFSDMGIPAKDSPLDVAESSDVVITMLPSSSHVLDVYTGPNGLLHGGSIVRPLLFIDSSTIDPQTSRKLSAAVSQCALKQEKDDWKKPVMLDAPVSGGVIAAEAGWWFPGSLSVCQTPISLNGKKHNLLWRSRNWFCKLLQAAKICNNLAMAVSMLGVSEALALGQSLGIDASTLTQVFNSSSARCWSSDSYNPVPGVMEGVPASRNYAGGFASKLMSKDLNLAAASAKDVGIECPLTSQAGEIYESVCKDGHESEDFSCVFRHHYSGQDEL